MASATELISRAELARLARTATRPADWHRHPRGGGWVYAAASVADTVRVDRSSVVCDTAKVSGRVVLRNGAVVRNAAVVRNRAMVTNAVVAGSAIVGGNTRITSKSLVVGSARVSGYAIVMAASTVAGEARVSGQSIIDAGSRVDGMTLIVDGYVHASYIHANACVRGALVFGSILTADTQLSAVAPGAVIVPHGSHLTGGHWRRSPGWCQLPCGRVLREWQPGRWALQVSPCVGESHYVAARGAASSGEFVAVDDVQCESLLRQARALIAALQPSTEAPPTAMRQRRRVHYD